MKVYLFRKRVQQLLLVLVILSLSSMASALKGGPDKFGYRYVDSHDITGPKYSWEYDVSEEREALVSDLHANGLGNKMKIGFPFNFYGVDYNYVYVAGNGYLTFVAGDWNNHIYSGESVPSSGAPNNIIAPLWGKLDVLG